MAFERRRPGLVDELEDFVNAGREGARLDVEHCSRRGYALLADAFEQPGAVFVVAEREFELGGGTYTYDRSEERRKCK